MLKYFFVLFILLSLVACINENEKILNDNEEASIEVSFDGESIIEIVVNSSSSLIDLSHPTLEKWDGDSWIIVDTFALFDFEEESIIIPPNESSTFAIPFSFTEFQQNSLFRYSRMVTFIDLNETIYLYDEFDIK